jgi:hypothetical protein
MLLFTHLQIANQTGNVICETHSFIVERFNILTLCYNSSARQYLLRGYESAELILVSLGYPEADRPLQEKSSRRKKQGQTVETERKATLQSTPRSDLG